MPDLGIYCDTVLLPDGWARGQVISVDPDGWIASVDVGEPADAQVILNGPVLAGMPNCHSHGFQRLLAGLTGAAGQDTDSFWSWREAMYRQANRMTADQFEGCLAWVYAEMLKAGYTSCAEFHYLHHQPGGKPYSHRAEMSLRVLEAANAAGIGTTLLPVLYSSSGFGLPVTERQQRFHNTLDEYLRIVEECVEAIGEGAGHAVGLAPHSLRAVPPEPLKSLAAYAGRVRLPVHIHIAEQRKEVEDCLEHLGARPVEWLLDNVLPGANWCLVHATHMNSEELKRAAASRAVAGLCPTTEADLGDGYFDLSAWMTEGGRFAIGSDSNLRISVSEELRLLEFYERLKSGHRNVLQDEVRSCGRFLYEHAAGTGADALGRKIGKLARGYRADLVELDGNHPLLAYRAGDEVLDTLLFAGGPEMVHSVFVAGEQVVEGGRHVREDELLRGFNAVVKDVSS